MQVPLYHSILWVRETDMKFVSDDELLQTVYEYAE